MDIIQKIVEFFKKPEEETVNESPVGVCSLCWGFQEYDGKIRELYRDKQVDVNNHKDSYMLVQGFVKAHVDGYHIKKTESCTCVLTVRSWNRGRIELKSMIYLRKRLRKASFVRTNKKNQQNC